MLVSLNWLKNYVDFGDLSAEELGELITKSGIEVDGIDFFAEKSSNVVVGYVESCEQHPDADKLSLCQVDVDENENLQIICGAPNIAKGQKVAVAKPGAVLPGNFKINKVKLRGIESNGMICSLEELGIEPKYIPTDIADGIFVFPEDAKIGENVDKLLNLNDAILEFDLTPNRSDALSMIGVAYEVAAILDLPINLPDESLETIEEKVTDYITVCVESSKQTPYYEAFMITDIVVKESPLWIKNYLMAAGIRPINNVVDITNFVLFEYGQPLHAFDYDLLQSKEIYVRQAKDEETIVTLDNKTRTLNTENIVVTDGNNPIALAGVMGGAETEVNNDTKTILLEAAYFNPKSVRKTVQDTGLRSEASTRFEKGIDPSRVKRAGERASQLLAKYANGKVLQQSAVFDELDKSEKSVAFSTNKINKRLGTEISTIEIKEILRKLRFESECENDDFKVSIPTRRGDITIFEDMLEEIARIYGYDNLPFTLPANDARVGELTLRQKLKRQIDAYLQGVGLMETITYSLTSKDFTERLVSPELNSEKLVPVGLSMPMSGDHQYLRLSILPELLKVLSYNRARTQTNMAYYEQGSVFLSEQEVLTEQPDEQLRLAGALTGTWLNHKWQKEQKQVDFYLIKGIVESLFDYLNISVEFNQAKLPDMHPGRSAIISMGDQTVGFIGQVHPAFAKKLDLKETYVFDLNMEVILKAFDNRPEYQLIHRYPSTTRDIAFIVDNNIHASEIKYLIEKTGSPLVTNVEVFDVYTGDNLEENKKSLAYSLSFQDSNKTLKDDEVEELYQEIVSTVNEKFDAYIRT